MSFVRFIFFVVKESLKKIWNYNEVEFASILDISSKKLIISNLRSQDNLISHDYLEELNGVKYGAIILNDAVYYKGNFFQKLFLTVFFFGHLKLIVLISLFKKNKKGFIYSAFEIVEVISLIKYMRDNKYNHVTTFNSFEKSANFFAYMLNLYNIKITKVCTPNPIKIHYKFVVANEFVFTSPYQKDEYELLKDNWFVEKTLLWPVYEFKHFKDYYYAAKEQDNNTNVIGFYSSGFLRRSMNKDNPMENSYLDSEIKMLDLLKNFIKKFPEFRLKVYLHPIEKTNEACYKESINLYREFFNGSADKIDFSEMNTPTWKDFDSVNVSLAVISTVNHERLFCGYKTLYAPLCFSNFSLDNTRLEPITIKKEENFESILLDSLKMSRQTFFKQNHIEDFVFYSLPN
jgi:hypothetical protein